MLKYDFESNRLILFSDEVTVELFTCLYYSLYATCIMLSVTHKLYNGIIEFSRFYTSVTTKQTINTDCFGPSISG